MRAELFASLLQGGKRSSDGWIARCPAHDDKTPSLSIGVGEGDRVLLKCFAGCDAESIVRNMGLELSDLMGESNPVGGTGGDKDPDRVYFGRPIERRYPYRDPAGKLLYEVLRLVPKDFRQRRPDPGKPGAWVPHLECSDPAKCRSQGHDPIPQATERTIYRLDELAKRPKEPVVVLEGEKDADAVVAATGALATCNTGGAGKGKWQERFSLLLAGRPYVVVVGDNDPVGRVHAGEVAASLQRHGVYARVAFVDRGKDFSDLVAEVGPEDAAEWLGAELAETRIDWEQEQHERDRSAEESSEARMAREALPEFGDKQFSLVELIDLKMPPPEGFIEETIFCRGDVGFFAGPDGSFKTFFAVYFGGQVALGRRMAHIRVRQGRFLFVSQEMMLRGIAARVSALYSLKEAAEMGDRFMLDGSLELDFFAEPDKSMRVLKRSIEKAKADFFVVDALVDCHSGDENSNRDMGGVLRAIRQVARDTDSAGAIIAHASKPSEFRTGANKLRCAGVQKGIAADILMFQPRRGSNPPRSYIGFPKTRNGARPDPLDVGVDFSKDPGKVLFTVSRASHDEAEHEEATEFRRGGQAGRGGEGSGDRGGSGSPVPIGRREADFEVLRAAVRRVMGEAGMVPAPKEAVREVCRILRPDWGEGRFDKRVAEAIRMEILTRTQSGKEAYLTIPEAPGGPEPEGEDG